MEANLLYRLEQCSSMQRPSCGDLHKTGQGRAFVLTICGGFPSGVHRRQVTTGHFHTRRSPSPKLYSVVSLSRDPGQQKLLLHHAQGCIRANQSIELVAILELRPATRQASMPIGIVAERSRKCTHSILARKFRSSVVKSS